MDHFIGGIVLTGGGSKLKHIDKVCEYLTQLDTRLGRPKEHITSDSPQELGDPVFATAIGLVIYGIRCEEENRIFHVELGHHEQEEEEQCPVAVREDVEVDVETSAKVDEEPVREKKGFNKWGRMRDYIVRWLGDDDDVQ